VESLNADLLFLQEVEEPTFAAIENLLSPRGYGCVYEKKGQGEPDGCASFYRKDRLIARTARRVEYQDAGHVASLLCLEHEGRLLGAANTHLRWEPPGTPRENHSSYRQVCELLAVIADFKPACDGWLVGGDFNSHPDDDVVLAMTSAGFAIAHADRGRVCSCKANGRAMLVDYLFYSGLLVARPFNPLAITDETILPSEQEPSDHVALMAEFAWKATLGSR
jgi:mRNA deadenylase 3'-5' endonuclease subunit Ccr4